MSAELMLWIVILSVLAPPDAMDIFFIAVAPLIFIVAFLIESQQLARAEEIARRRGIEIKRARMAGFEEGFRDGKEAERENLSDAWHNLAESYAAFRDSRRERFTVNEYLIAYRRGEGGR
ncbi:hypothetical protein C4587_00860 [Candidatus Parcubacteria bacterium]|nr:MAG: hypothetical protein C4587_00860 [Candidatus Parcubacteria bacterium]